ncbi:MULTISPECIES: PTS cellobiose transporter subunit IIC [Enterococcus]|uniref:Permease IIC component n=1 Tax=Enterococcus thailandicus TaxID=417368 RepID=A0A179ET18_ENTTH|nr:PTS cellobiose transporter subunit IIC [Enterococcus thailandicus]MDT2793840.1 PTS cellobiose transporter subunit IIC [Enterococcus thailandicus]MDT2845706.1 PTS cellobiose transporter subunit IIC [Enterococcus thailandicus]OAQ56368.1 PTS system, cellobiose-specific IIC component [Enterococcus thailandicus]OJG95885.1 PTS system, lactose/cellobiose family IIC component [Enterococcus thailandicus]GEK36280.1 permease IIC component [Enterococcus thailandicus]
MQKFLNWLEKVLTPLAKVIGENKYLVAIRDGFLLSTPLLIVGSVFLLIANFPLPQWNEWMSALLGDNWEAMMSVPASASFDVMTILAVVGIAYSLGKQFHVDAMQSGIIALVSFFILTPYQTLFTPEGSTTVYEVTSLPLKWMGSSGLFLGMIVALISTRLFVAMVRKGWTIKMPDGVPPTVVKSFEALIPSFVVVTMMFLVNWLVSLTSYGNLQDVIFTFLQTPLLSLGNTLGAMIIAYLFLHFFWFFGINGSSVVGAVFNPVLRALSVENLQAFKDGHEIPNIITGQFQDMFATFGGAGSTLSLIVVMVLFCKSQRIKKLSQLSLIPGIFGINEPVIFGLPIVLNPILLVPFALVPTINIIIAYFSMNIGLVPYTNGIQLPWTTPPIISGFLVSGWQGAVLQGLLFVLGMAIYYPFIKVMDVQYLREEVKTREEELDEINLDDFDFDDI